MNKNPLDNRPEYEIAQENCSSLFVELGIACEISKPFPMVLDTWPCIAYDMTFIKGNARFKVEYHLGVGHVKYPNTNSLLSYRLTLDEEACLRTKQRNPSANMKDKQLEASLAVKLATIQKVQPVPSEVLATVAREGLEVMQQDFEEWASNLGFDSDSIKAKGIYDTCTENYRKLLKILNHEQVEKFADYASQF